MALPVAFWITVARTATNDRADKQRALLRELDIIRVVSRSVYPVRFWVTLSRPACVRGGKFIHISEGVGSFGRSPSESRPNQLMFVWQGCAKSRHLLARSRTTEVDSFFDLRPEKSEVKFSFRFFALRSLQPWFLSTPVRCASFVETGPGATAKPATT
jgi:hypothetical protein